MTSTIASRDAEPLGQPLIGQQAVVVGGLRRSFDGRTVIDGVNLAVERGEFVALLGRSGTGKSTLLRILAGLDSEASGDVCVAKQRAVVFQEPRLLPWLRVIDNVELGLRGPDRGERARAALLEVGMGEKARAWPVTLSGGEAQRASLARALVREPQLLLLDEPFGSLDALTRLKMHALLAALWRRHRPAVLLVTHDVDEAIALADRVLVLESGAFVENVTIEQADVIPGSERFVRLRSRLLNALGVTDADGWAQRRGTGIAPEEAVPPLQACTPGPAAKSPGQLTPRAGWPGDPGSSVPPAKEPRDDQHR